MSMWKYPENRSHSLTGIPQVIQYIQVLTCVKHHDCLGGTMVMRYLALPTYDSEKKNKKHSFLKS